VLLRVGPSWVVYVVPEAVVGDVVATVAEAVEVVRAVVGELEVVVVAAPGTTK